MPAPHKPTPQRNRDRHHTMREEVQLVDKDFENTKTPGYRFSGGRVFDDAVTKRKRY